MTENMPHDILSFVSPRLFTAAMPPIEDRNVLNKYFSAILAVIFADEK